MFSKFLLIIPILLSVLGKTFDTQNCGSASSISGKTIVLYCFASYEEDDDVSCDEKNRFIESLGTAVDYIEDECREFGKSSEFVCISDGSVKIPRNVNIQELRPKDICKIRHGDNYKNYVNNLKSQYEAKNVVYIFVTDKRRVSQAFSTYDIAPNVFYLEGCAIHLKDGGVLSTVITHEILHCYGAYDLYYSEIYRESDGTIAYKRKLSRSIMYDTRFQLSDIYIDEFTAYLIGLSDSYYEWFDKLKRNGAN